jgi:hypothetical protein
VHLLKNYAWGVFPAIPCHMKEAHVHVCMCVCVCVCDRDRERGNTVSQQHPLKIHPSPRHVACSTARHLVTCVTRNRKKEDYSKRHNWGHTGSLQHYPLEMTKCWRILLVANLFSYWDSTCSGFLQHVVGSLLPEFWRNIPSSFSAFTCIHEEEGGVCSWTVGKKLPDYTVQWPRTSGSTTITWWKLQITLFVLLRILFLTHSYPSFTVSCWCRPV